MNIEELNDWFEQTTEDDFFKDLVNFIEEDFLKLSVDKLPKVIMLWVPNENRYIYWQASVKTSGETPSEVARYCRKNKTLHYKMKDLISPSGKA